MDFLSNSAKGNDSKKHPAGEEKSATAAKSQSSSAQKRAAAAAADLLDAVSDYRKLDETKGVGKYVDQAEGYLRKYSGEGKAPTTTTHGGGGTGDYMKMAQEYFNKPSEGGEKKKAGGGSGDLLKAAGSFFSK